jgi:hypothetical protein
LLSVGGWGARGFSGAAATKETRAVFIQSAQAIIEKYGLDGIDLDWEYPVNGAWGLVASQPADRDNFTALLKELRAAVGTKTGDHRRRRKRGEPKKLGGRQSDCAIARLHQPDDLRPGLRHPVLQFQPV